MLNKVDAVLNCAGPYSNTGLLLAAAAIRNRTHYLDPNAVEQLAAKRHFDELDTTAKQAGVSFREVAPTRAIEEFDFGANTAKTLVLSNYPRSEIAMVPRHVPSKRIVVKMAFSTIRDLASADRPGRDGRVRYALGKCIFCGGRSTDRGRQKQVTAAGNDIYGITAPFMVNGLELLPASTETVAMSSPAGFERASLRPATLLFSARCHVGRIPIVMTSDRQRSHP